MTICQYYGEKGILLQALNWRLYKSISLYYFTQNIKLFKLAYKQLLQTRDWEQGVNEKTFPANQPSPDNQMVGLEHDGEYQTGYGNMFNMILKDGTRSDNAMTVDGEVLQKYDYRLPQNKRITSVTVYYE